MLKINVTACLFLHNTLMTSVIYETVIRKSASKVCCEKHELCLFFIIWICEKAVSQRYVEANGINIRIAAFKLMDILAVVLTEFQLVLLTRNLVSKSLY